MWNSEGITCGEADYELQLWCKAETNTHAKGTKTMAAKTTEPRKAFCFVSDKTYGASIRQMVRQKVGITLTYNDREVFYELPADSTKADQRRVQDLLTGFATAVSEF